MKSLPTKTIDGKLHYGLTHFKDLALLPDELLEQAVNQLTSLILQIRLLLVVTEARPSGTDGPSAQEVFDLLETTIWFCFDQDDENQIMQGT